MTIATRVASDIITHVYKWLPIFLCLPLAFASAAQSCVEGLIAVSDPPEHSTPCTRQTDRPDADEESTDTEQDGTGSPDESVGVELGVVEPAPRSFRLSLERKLNPWPRLNRNPRSPDSDLSRTRLAVEPDPALSEAVSLSVVALPVRSHAPPAQC